MAKPKRRGRVKIIGTQRVNNFLKKEYFSNSTQQWLEFFAFTLGLFLILVLLKLVLAAIFSRVEKTEKISKFKNVFKATRYWILLLLALFLTSSRLELKESLRHLFEKLALALVLLQLFLWLWRLIDTVVEDKIAEARLSNGSTITSIKTLGFLGKALLLSIILILILDNFGVNVMALVTGLGVGGIAIALAAQNILKDFFASLTIVLDKPFHVQDFIVTGDYKGTVESVGIKSTRLRSLDGEEIIVANSILLDNWLRNFKRMERRRICFELGVVYQTPLEKLKKIPELIRGILESKEKTELDRVHFKSFGNSALIFEVVYYVLGPEYNQYMDLQQEINLEITKRFQEEKIEFAYPTQVLYLNPS